MILDYFFSYCAYLLGAFIFVLDQIKKYQDIANANPDPKITYKPVSFWYKERYSLMQIALYGIVSVVIIPRLFGGSTFALQKATGEIAWSVSMKVAQLPLQIIIGWSGGRMLIALLGKSKAELYKKVGITDAENKP